MTDFEFVTGSVDEALTVEEKGVVMQTWPEEQVAHMWIDGKVYELKMTFIKESEYPE